MSEPKEPQPGDNQEPKIEHHDKDLDVKVMEAADWLFREVNAFSSWGHEIQGRISRGTLEDSDKEMILEEVEKLKEIRSNMIEMVKRGMK